MLDHWVPVESIIAREAHPQAPLPKGFVPDPPGFSVCAAYLRSQSTKTPLGQLKTQCREQYEHTRTHILTILITAAWLGKEAAVQHITVTSGEVEEAWSRYKREEFPSQAAYQRFVKYTGETTADERMIVRANIIVEKLREKRKATLGQAGAEQAAYDFPKHWATQTSCSPQYIIPDCKQYTGPQPPESSI